LEYCRWLTITTGVEGANVISEPRTFSAGFQTIDRTCPAGTALTDTYEAHTGTYWPSPDETGDYYFQAGVLFYLSGESTGFQYSSLAISGTSTTDHLSPLNSGDDAAYYDADGNYTQAYLISYLTALRAPNIAFIQLGINRSTGEAGGDESHLLAHKAFIEKIALRYRAAMLAAGATDPQVVLVTHWQVADNTSSNITWAAGKAAKYAELCDDYDWLAMADLNGVLIEEDGDFDAWSGTLLSDTIHQTEAGVLRFAEILWNLLEGALGGPSNSADTGVFDSL
jgi:lysophospholipase L1-like esterase